MSTRCLLTKLRVRNRLGSISVKCNIWNTHLRTVSGSNADPNSSDRNERPDPDLDEEKFDSRRKEEMRQKQEMYDQKARAKHEKYINKMEFEMKINEEWEKQKEKEKEKKDFKEFTFTASDKDFPQTKDDQRLKYAALFGIGIVSCFIYKFVRS